MLAMTLFHNAIMQNHFQIKAYFLMFNLSGLYKAILVVNFF